MPCGDTQLLLCIHVHIFILVRIPFASLLGFVLLVPHCTADVNDASGSQATSPTDEGEDTNDAAGGDAPAPGDPGAASKNSKRDYSEFLLKNSDSKPATMNVRNYQIRKRPLQRVFLLLLFIYFFWGGLDLSIRLV